MLPPSLRSAADSDSAHPASTTAVSALSAGLPCKGGTRSGRGAGWLAQQHLGLSSLIS